MMRIPILPMTSDADNEILLGSVYFDVLTPKMKGETRKLVRTKEKKEESDERPTALVMDVKGLQRRNLNDVLLKRLRIRGTNVWFLTNIESVDDVFDAFNTDAEAVLVPSHTVRSPEEFSDILDVSDSVIPVLFVRKRNAVLFGKSDDYRKVIDEAVSFGYGTVAVFDLDDSIPENDWQLLRQRCDIIPCSFTGSVTSKRFEEMGFDRCFTVPE